MTPEVQELVLKAIHEVNQKVLYESEQKGREEGFEEGFKEGFEEGFKEGFEEVMLKVARNLKGEIDDERISTITGLRIDKINSI